MSKLKSFTCEIKGESYFIDLTKRRNHKSNESSGVWVCYDKAWKIFPNMNQWHRVDHDYTKAKECGLPTPSFTQAPGTIINQHGLTDHGFALSMTYITPPAKFFALKHGTGSLESHIKPITDDTILSRIEHAFQTAINMGLQDPQGFINKDGPVPIMFIDIHTNTAAAGSLYTIRDYVSARRATLYQQYLKSQ